MLYFILWYLVVSLLGLATFPLAYRLFPGLPDRGYAFNKTLGTLLWGYLFWICWSVKILRNDIGGLLVALGVLIVAGFLVLRTIDRQELQTWWRSHRHLVLVVEVLFLLAFAGLAVVRAANPDITGTEKPMELAFINAILRSPDYPPHDPWLSGYAISYYYFGYVLVAMLARLTGTPGSIAFNLGLSLVFGLSAINSYGLVYNLLRSRLVGEGKIGEIKAQVNAWYHASLALLGPLFILLVSNIEGFLEILYNRGYFWQKTASGVLTSRFWTWLDIVDLNQPNSISYQWAPRSYESGSWWWWRASRVVQDYGFDQKGREIIDEFPFFSYLLGDLHPHVLAMPFMFLVMALALNLYLGGAKGEIRLPFVRLHINRQSFLLGGLVLGGMAFLNTWDILIAAGILAGAYALRRMKESVDPQGKSGFIFFKDFVTLGVVLGVTAVIFYLPYFLGFSSQAGGIIPGMLFFTHGNQFWVMFTPLLLPIIGFLVFLWRKNAYFSAFKTGALTAVAYLLLLWLLMWLFSIFIVGVVPALKSLNPQAEQVPGLFLGNQGAPSLAELLRATMLRRLQAPGAWITLTVLLAATTGLLFGIKRNHTPGETEETAKNDSQISHSVSMNPDSFALLLVFLVLLILLGVEFFYLRDQFGSRINTIFKFFYQAWLLWGIVAAYGIAVLMQELRGKWAFIIGVGLVIILGVALVYPLYGVWDVTSGFKPAAGYTLDGNSYLASWTPDEVAAVLWLEAAQYGVLVEAVAPGGGSYTDFARVSECSGLPTVLGWVGHEQQWRGGGKEIGTRQEDIQILYSSRDWNETQAILQRYGIRYIYLGQRERSTYRVYEGKFQRYLTPVFQQGDVVIYQNP